ncbi:uncharacterized protein N7473_011505 [Penicillium subrubescens]|uniref:uncharacterized protein n=1 Tax=Penicillium subrubescens TaxID=1316194 RepID=UPI002545A8BD|nr:uncharacterized protein N7473_011505 [Penicillium subrubescens]KAJ5880452.1 hypothetical protein N7473_011505 [Penicillium subrubescens]
MTQSTTSHHRRSPSSPHTIIPKSKPAVRPGLHRRGTSGVSLSISKLGSGHHHHHSSYIRSHSRGINKADDDFDMAASFLNFCPPAELVLPRACRLPSFAALPPQRLSKTPLSLSPINLNPLHQNVLHQHQDLYLLIHHLPTNIPPLSPRTIVAPMTPTVISSSTPVPSIRIPATIHDGKSDLDPTEWKPVLGARTDSTGSTTSTTSTTSGSSLATSDAWGYLSQFHGGSSTFLAPRSHRSTTSLSTLDVTGTPSLTHAPSIASSVSSTASYEPEHELGHRPLPPRHNPFFSLSHAAEKGMALVVPQVEAVAVQDVESDSGSIFPASSSVWEDGVTTATKGSAPIMVRGRGRVTKV